MTRFVEPIIFKAQLYNRPQVVVGFILFYKFGDCVICLTSCKRLFEIGTVCAHTLAKSVGIIQVLSFDHNGNTVNMKANHFLSFLRSG